MLILNDEQIIEGILGGFGWLLMMYEMKKVLRGRANMYTTSIFAWTFFWYIRKIGMNLYKDLKSRNGWPDDALVVSIDNDSPHIFFLIFLTLAGLLFATSYTFNMKDLFLTLAITSLLFLLYIT